jgi:SAM-dependent methyltransferase
MTAPLSQHQQEIGRNLLAWEGKPLLRRIYDSFYDRILPLIELGIPGRVVEIGSGIGNLKARLPDAICTDLFPNAWLDLACDGYELPFRAGALSHLVLFDVFHHLQWPAAFLKEARRALGENGRLILFEPFVSLASRPIYGWFHHEPIGSTGPIARSETAPAHRAYYAAQGNATRLFFGADGATWREGWQMFHAEAFSCFAYLLSGGYSKPAFYPERCLSFWSRLDAFLSRWPRWWAGRCLVGLRKG